MGHSFLDEGKNEKCKEVCVPSTRLRMLFIVAYYWYHIILRFWTLVPHAIYAWNLFGSLHLCLYFFLTLVCLTTGIIIFVFTSHVFLYHFLFMKLTENLKEMCMHTDMHTQWYSALYVSLLLKKKKLNSCDWEIVTSATKRDFISSYNSKFYILYSCLLSNFMRARYISTIMISSIFGSRGDNFLKDKNLQLPYSLVVSLDWGREIPLKY